MTQPVKILGLKLPVSQADFTSVRATCQYIGVSCRPDVCAAVQLLAPGEAPSTSSEFNTLLKAIERLKKTSTIGMKFVQLDVPSLRLVLVTDSSLENARNHRGQLGYILVLADKHSRCNLIHFSSSRFKCITRSVMASEVHVLTTGFDCAFTVQHFLAEILGRTVAIEAYIDSKTVFDLVAKDGRSTEKRLSIEIAPIK